MRASGLSLSEDLVALERELTHEFTAKLKRKAEAGYLRCLQSWGVGDLSQILPLKSCD